MSDVAREITRTYTFAFEPDPDGGFVVTCPALPGLVTHGATLEDARAMAVDAMGGYIEVLRDDGELVPESDPPQAGSRFDRLAKSLRGDGASSPTFEQLTAKLTEAA